MISILLVEATVIASVMLSFASFHCDLNLSRGRRRPSSESRISDRWGSLTDCLGLKIT